MTAATAVRSSKVCAEPCFAIKGHPPPRSVKRWCNENRWGVKKRSRKQPEPLLPYAYRGVTGLHPGQTVLVDSPNPLDDWRKLSFLNDAAAATSGLAARFC